MSFDDSFTSRNTSTLRLRLHSNSTQPTLMTWNRCALMDGILSIHQPWLVLQARSVPMFRNRLPSFRSLAASMSKPTADGSVIAPPDFWRLGSQLSFRTQALHKICRPAKVSLPLPRWKVLWRGGIGLNRGEKGKTRPRGPPPERDLFVSNGP